MNEEQNIGDFVELLKNTVSTQEEGSPESVDNDFTDEYISYDMLKEQLKSRYIDDELITDDVTASIGEYTIDNDFLRDVETMRDEDTVFDEPIQTEPIQTEPETIELEALAGRTEAEDIVELDNLTEASDVDKDAETVEDSFVLYEAKDNDSPIIYGEDVDDEAFIDDEFAKEALVENDVPEEQVAVFENADPDLSDETFDLDEYLEDAVVIDEMLEKEIETEANVTEDAPVDGEHLLSVEEIDAFELLSEEDISAPCTEDTHESEEVAHEPHETFIASMRKIGFDFASERIDGTEAQSADAADDDLSEDLSGEDLDYSTINLMMQFCEKEELDKTIGGEKMADYIRHQQTEIADEHVTSAAFEGEEYSNKKQNEKIIEKYRHERFTSLARLGGCALVALIATIFEMLPLLGVGIEGLLDYTNHPAVFILFGLQFVVFAAAICYKQLWAGLKRAFSSSPNKDSIVAVALLLTAVYDVIVAIVVAVAGDDIPSTFNAIAVITVALSALADYVRITAEMKAFSVYSSDSKKYTLVKDSKQGRIATKMYVGGLPMENNVYSVKSIDFPRGFFKCVGKDRSADKIITAALIPVLVIGLVATIVTIVLGAGAYDACAVFLLTLYAILPISYIYSGIFPNAFATIKLARRGSAVAGEKMISKYNDCDVIVFDDLHMFKKCKTEEIGIAIYDTRFAYLILGCISALYSKIGGPLSGVQMQLPDVFKFNDVAIRRIARNGVEAVVDRKHVLIVGDIEFMKRYGLAFPENEKKNDRSTLCVSVNGGVSAKLSIRYETEPVFEMLVERLNAEGILCAVQTYDPLINSATAAKARTIGSSPISVIHMNADDYASKTPDDYREELDGIVSCSSRLKLAETEVWVKRQAKVAKMLKRLTVAFSVLGALLVTIFVVTGAVGAVNQFYLLAFLLAQIAAATTVMLLIFPSKNYFTTEALYFELEREHEKEIKKAEKNR